MKRVLIADLTCPKPYDASTLETVPQGGTESTVTRVAEALAEAGHRVQVAQHNRTDAGQGKAEYLPFDACEREQDTVICLRTPFLLPFVKEKFTQHKLYLWAHDFNQAELAAHAEMLAEMKAVVLGVSRTHKGVICDAFLTQAREVRGVRVDFVYNPIDDTLIPNDTPVLQRKLVFFSSPHKGLENTLRVFGHLRRNIPMLSLYVANPGYIENGAPNLPGVIWLGSLTHAEVIQHVREAFAVLHLNDVFNETYGLVHGEAMAVGTPVITGKFGANTEILGLHSGQMLDVRDERAVLERYEFWVRNGRPRLELNPELRLSAVIKKWEELL